MGWLQITLLLIVATTTRAFDFSGVVGECRVKFPGNSKIMILDFGLEEEMAVHAKSFSSSHHDASSSRQGFSATPQGSTSRPYDFSIPTGVDPTIWNHLVEPAKRQVLDHMGILSHAPCTTPSPGAVSSSSTGTYPKVVSSIARPKSQLADRQYHNLTVAEQRQCEECLYSGRVGILRPRNVTFSDVVFECQPLDVFRNSTRHAIVYHVYVTPFSCKSRVPLRLLHSSDIAKIHSASPSYLSSWLSSIRFLPAFHAAAAPEFAWIDSVLKRQIERLQKRTSRPSQTG